MLNYMKIPQDDDTFVSIPEACERLGLTKDELRAKCEQYGVDLYNWDGQWGFPIYHFRCFNNTLYYEQYRDGYDDSYIFANTPAKRTAAYELPQQRMSTLSYIKNIRGLESTYTLAEVCKLLGVTADEVAEICTANNLFMHQDLDGTWYLTCYGYLTLNNMLYHKQCVASEKGSRCV